MIKKKGGGTKKKRGDSELSSGLNLSFVGTWQWEMDKDGKG